jgi:hypothetical protein
MPVIPFSSKEFYIDRVKQGTFGISAANVMTFTPTGGSSQICGTLSVSGDTINPSTINLTTGGGTNYTSIWGSFIAIGIGTGKISNNSSANTDQSWSTDGSSAP